MPRRLVVRGSLSGVVRGGLLIGPRDCGFPNGPIIGSHLYTNISMSCYQPGNVVSVVTGLVAVGSCLLLVLPGPPLPVVGAWGPRDFPGTMPILLIVCIKQRKEKGKKRREKKKKNVVSRPASQVCVYSDSLTCRMLTVRVSASVSASVERSTPRVRRTVS